MARFKVNYKAYENDWKYGKGVGIFLVGTFGFQVLQIELYLSNGYVIKPEYMSARPWLWLLLIIGVIVYFYSSYMNKQKAIQKYEMDLSKRRETIRELRNAFIDLYNSLDIEDDHKLRFIYELENMNDDEVIELYMKYKDKD